MTWQVLEVWPTRVKAAFGPAHSEGIQLSPHKAWASHTLDRGELLLTIPAGKARCRGEGVFLWPECIKGTLYECVEHYMTNNEDSGLRLWGLFGSISPFLRFTHSSVNASLSPISSSAGEGSCPLVTRPLAGPVGGWCVAGWGVCHG